ncbi:transposase [Holospora obtusa F1]|uniref:Transposase n=1 Tax=Holospora obtusa F1 TaxID=1399147 RepID=W6TT73_HOLOB|nr:IS630 transposase-related protein [Holospora obtusa]ETZ06967.1 transposase [Holospora obtusa F1]
MSTRPCRIDLREKVINFIKAGNSQKEASRVFEINKMIINRWYLRYKSQEHFRQKIRLGAKPTIEKESFIQYETDHPKARSEDIAREFSISASGAHYWLRRVVIKKPSPM